jgi:transcription initiation factor TFIIE subunit alpha
LGATVAVREEEWVPALEDPEVRTYILDEVGPEGLEMAAYLREHPGISGVDILEHHKAQKASQVRRTLYRMMEAHAAEYEKETDSKGWETFLWHLDLMEIKYILRRRWADEIRNLRRQIKFERDHEFYACKSQHRRMLFEDALDLQFLCPVCHEAMQPVKTKDVQRALQERLDELEPYFPEENALTT